MSITQRAKTLLIAIVLVVCLVGSLSGCGTMSQVMGPDQDEYVGVWACYLAKASGNEFRPDSINEANSFIVLEANGDAELVARVGDETSTSDGSWFATYRSESEGTDAGIRIVGKKEGFENIYRYYIGDDMKPNLISERLMDGNLVIDYGYRKEYLEKISDDPNYQPWATGDSEATTKASSMVDDTAPTDAIKWTKASQHIGEDVTVYGTIVEAEYASASSGSPTFLDMGAAYPDEDRVSIVIWGKNRTNFSSSPETFYDGKTVCVTGEVYLYKGVCTIEVSSPSQIEVI